VQISHRPWPLHRAELLHHDGDLLAVADVEPMTREPASALWSPGVSCSLLPVPGPGEREGGASGAGDSPAHRTQGA